MQIARIYLLSDPRPGEKRGYVGWTIKTAQARLKIHLRDGRWRNSRKYDWFQELKGSGLVPIISVLEECNREGALKREIFWGNWAIAQGYELVNIAPFGRGYDHEMRQEIRAKISERLRGRPKPFGHSQKISRANRGRKLSEQHRQKLSESLKKRYQTNPEDRERLRKLAQAQFQNEDFRERHRKSMEPIFRSKEYRKNMRESLINAWRKGRFDKRKKRNA